MNNGKICVSVCAETANEFIEKIERAAKIADVVELRFDCLIENERETVLNQLDKLKVKVKRPFLGTFRPKSIYGSLEPVVWRYKDEETKERRIKEREERLSFWEKLLANESVDWLDIEGDIQNLICWNITNENIWNTNADLSWERNFVSRLGKRRFITSEHNFEKTPEEIASIYELLATNLREVDEKDEDIKILTSGIIKVATQANDTTDGLALMKLLERAKAENRELIPIAMGENGAWTRILGLSRGAFLTFAALDETSATAPGQFTAEEMKDVYRVKELDEKTEIYGLVAGSTAYSVSPQMHNAAFKFHNLNAVYVPFAVKNLAEFVRRMVHPKTREIDWNFGGFSVTLPHKVEIMKHLDFVDETAEKIGAVNTVKIENDQLLGFNTDAAGFVEPLKNAFGDLKNARIAVFGAGGAARACVYALQREGASVTVFARNIEKATDLVVDFGVKISNLTSEILNLKGFDIVVNATPLGMKKGGLENETPAFAEQLEGVKLVYDLVYNPFETRLMQEAAKVFVPTIGGLAMLVAQAMAQQKIWTGKDAPMKDMSRAALRKLNR